MENDIKEKENKKQLIAVEVETELLERIENRIKSMEFPVSRAGYLKALILKDLKENEVDSCESS